MRLKGEVILITGGAGGLGEAMARRFTASGARVAICDLKEDDVADAKTRMAADGAEVFGMAADTTDEASMAAVVAATIEKFGSLSGLVTTAGIRQPAASYMDLDLALWQKVMNVNVTGTLIAVRAATPALIRSKGAIVTVSSVTGVAARMNQAAYCTSKAAVLHLTRQIALERARDGVRVNALCPGVTMTPMIESAIASDGPNVLRDKLEGSLEQFRPGIPLGRLATAAEQAAAAEFLLSDDASFITGAALFADGGVSMLS